MKNLVNFKVALKTREYLIQAIYQMFFNNQDPFEIIEQFKKEHQLQKVDFEKFSKSTFCSSCSFLNCSIISIGF